jgi:hypothetical protein
LNTPHNCAHCGKVVAPGPGGVLVTVEYEDDDMEAECRSVFHKECLEELGDDGARDLGVKEIMKTAAFQHLADTSPHAAMTNILN